MTSSNYGRLLTYFPAGTLLRIQAYKYPHNILDGIFFLFLIGQKLLKIRKNFVLKLKELQNILRGHNWFHGLLSSTVLKLIQESENFLLGSHFRRRPTWMYLSVVSYPSFFNSMSSDYRVNAHGQPIKKSIFISSNYNKFKYDVTIIHFRMSQII